jgi:hypothetical protein
MKDADPIRRNSLRLDAPERIFCFSKDHPH